MLEWEWCGERLTLLAERAVWRPARRTVYIADLHLGKDATFRRHGIGVPEGVAADDLLRLGGVLDRTGAERVVVLGDLIHARAGMTTATVRCVEQWRTRYQNVAIEVIRGNHDLRSGDPPPSWGMQMQAEGASDPPFRLVHAPPDRSDTVPTLAGHLHPVVGLSGGGNSRMAAVCFWLRANTLVLPAFTAFTGRTRIAAEAGDRVFVTGPESVIEAQLA